MNKFSNTEKGLTLVEVLISLGILVIFVPFVATMLINSQAWASYSKHKAQAAYAAQQIIESYRQQPTSFFAPRLAVQNPVNPPINGLVTLDTKGNYNNTSCQNPGPFCGWSITTIAPKTYTNNAGQTIYPPTATYPPPPAVGGYAYYPIAHLTVQISWWEQKNQMNENYNSDIIVNDSMLN